MNILVVCDTSWDNYAVMSRRLTSKYIDPEHRINIFYGEQMKHISKICNQNMLQIFRKSLNSNTLIKDLRNQMKFTKLCIIFHNFTEYNTISSVLINICKENGIPYFVFTEYTDDFFFNGEPMSTRFKKCVINVPNISKREDISCNIDFEISFATETNSSKDYSQIVHKLRNSYKSIDENRLKKSIIFVDNKIPKQYSYLEYMANKKKWIKEVIPR